MTPVTGSLTLSSNQLIASVVAGLLSATNRTTTLRRSEGMEDTQTVERRFACMVDDLNNGESMTVPGDIAVALFRNEEGQFFATADICTHEEWSLGSDSDLEGDEVICPLHMARFNIRNGAPLCFPATVALKTFDVEVDADKVYIIH